MMSVEWSFGVCKTAAEASQRVDGARGDAECVPELRIARLD